MNTFQIKFKHTDTYTPHDLLSSFFFLPKVKFKISYYDNKYIISGNSPYHIHIPEMELEWPGNCIEYTATNVTSNKENPYNYELTECNKQFYFKVVNPDRLTAIILYIRTESYEISPTLLTITYEDICDIPKYIRAVLY